MKTTLILRGIDFPVKLKDITKFENQNLTLAGINVFSIDKNKKFYPLRMTQKDCEKTIDLFLFEQDGKSHFSLIKNCSRLFRCQITSRTNGSIFIRKKFLTHFTKKELFEKHIAYCYINETVAVKIPARNEPRKFQNHYKQLPIPFVVHADLRNHFKHVNLILMILILTLIKNTSRLDFAFI